jgi:HAMP domain-containing protein
MKIEKTFLQSKVARRILALFIFCALVPIIALAVVSFTRVRSELKNQNERQLHQSGKALGMSILERLNILEKEFTALCSNPILSSGAFTRSTRGENTEELIKRFKGLAFITHSGEFFPRFGQIQKPPGLSAQETEHIRSGKTLMLTDTNLDNRRFYMMRFVDPKNRNRGILYGEINTMYLWFLSENQRDILPYKTELIVLDDSHQLIYSTIPVPSSLRERPEYKMPRRGRGIFEWEYEDGGYMASFRSLSLKFNPVNPEWTVVLTVPNKVISKPMAQFKQIFPLIVLLSFWVVLLLAFVQIRRTTHPLEKLREGTRRIASGDFRTRVEIRSGDEFEDLSASFNEMSRKIGNLIDELERFNWETLETLANTVDAKSRWTKDHSKRVTEKAVKIGVALGLGEDELNDLKRAGLLHDIGKLNIRDDILDKNAELTDEEFKELRGHPREGERILRPLKIFDAYASVLPMVRQHHERFDGNGYPDGLAKEDISLGARILAVADTYDALISDRPYRSGMKLERVIDINKYPPSERVVLS